MVIVTVGEIVGMTHERRYTRDGQAVPWHRPHRAITTPANRFHADTGTIHVMRPYVIEDADDDAWCRFRWLSHCGHYQLKVSAHGICAEKPADTDGSAWCHMCRTCQRLSEKSDEPRTEASR
jgi:hypothetical protein